MRWPCISGAALPVHPGAAQRLCQCRSKVNQRIAGCVRAKTTAFAGTRLSYSCASSRLSVFYTHGNCAAGNRCGSSGPRTPGSYRTIYFATYEKKTAMLTSVAVHSTAFQPPCKREKGRSCHSRAITTSGCSK